MSTLRPWLLPLLLASSCVVNPVPTPSTGGSTTAATNADSDKQSASDTASYPPGSGDGETALPPTAAAVGSFVPATATEVGVNGEFGDHFAIFAPAAPSTGRLVVLLPDATATPAQYQEVAKVAAQRGNRGLVLAYPNAIAAATLCGQDGGCFEYLRHETLDGQDRSPKVAVNFGNCVEQRLASALHWLDQNRKGEGWGAFVNGSTPDWSKFILVGHGEGADLAAFIGKQHKVARVVVLAGPTDATQAGPAVWLSSKSLTDPDRYLGLVLLADPGYAVISANWTALGIGPSCTAIAGQQTFSGTTCLTLAGSLQHPHDAVAMDSDLPLGPTDSSVLLPAFWYLFAP